jgi:hypothetical protein
LLGEVLVWVSKVVAYFSWQLRKRGNSFLYFVYADVARPISQEDAQGPFCTIHPESQLQSETLPLTLQGISFTDKSKSKRPFPTSCLFSKEKVI